MPDPPAPRARRASALPLSRRHAIGLLIALAHLLLLWAAAHMHWERPKLADVPLLVAVLAQPERPRPPEPVELPLPRPAEAPQPLAPPIPVPVLLPSVAPDQPTVLAAETTPAPPPPAPVIAAVVAAPPPPAPVPPPAPKLIPPAALQLLEPLVVDYPRASRRNAEAGETLVRVFVDRAGVPRNPQVERSSGFVRLDQAALASVQRARFRPYVENGQPVEGWALIPIRFELEK